MDSPRASIKPVLTGRFSPKRVAVLYTPAAETLADAPEKVREAEDLTANAHAVAKALREGKGHQTRCFDFGNDLGGLAARLRRWRPDIVFNLAEAPLGAYEKEAHAAAFLELLGFPYTGNGPAPLVICKDKALAKERMQAAGLPTPQFRVFDTVPKKTPKLRFPLVVKPLRQDGSLGITEQSVANNPSQLRTAVSLVLEQQRQEALVEEFLCGREFNVSVLGNGSEQAPYRAFPPGEYVYHSKQWRVCTFDAKWDERHPSYAAVEGVYPARVASRLQRHLEKLSVRCARLFALSGYSRIDLRLDHNGVAHVLEVNPNPDLAPRMGMARAVESGGLEYAAFVEEILKAGWLQGIR